MGQRVIRLTSRWALDAAVRVVVYDDLADLHAAAQRFNGNVMGEACRGATQVTMHERHDGTPVARPIVRLWRERLGTEVVSHEMHHAVTAIYGAHIAGTGDDPDLTHHNEPFAYLYGHLLARLVDRLYALGYYD